MFHDAGFTLMVMLMLFFCGMMLMFIFILRAFARHGDEMRESFRKQQMFLTDLERQFLDLKIIVQQLKKTPPADTPQPPRQEEGLSILREDDPLKALLENALRPAGAGGAARPPEGLLPPPLKTRPLAEEYTPVNGPSAPPPPADRRFGASPQGTRAPGRDELDLVMELGR